MTSAKLFIQMIVFCFLLSSTLSAQWEHVLGAPATGINLLTVSGDQLLAKSSYLNSRWYSLTQQRDQWSAFDVQYSRAGVYNDTLSADFVINGLAVFNNHTQRDTIVVVDSTLNAFVDFIFNQGNRYYAVSGANFYVATQLNGPWVRNTELHYPFLDGRIYNLHALGDSIYIQDAKYFYISYDNGLSWKRSPKADFTDRYLISIAHLGSKLVGRTTACEIAMSDDGGFSWKDLEIPIKAATQCVVFRDLIVLLDSTRLIKSFDGINWSELVHPVGPPEITNIAVLGNELYAAGAAGVQRMSMPSSDWQLLNQGFPNLQCIDYWKFGSCILQQGNSGSYISRDAGHSWGLLEYNMGDSIVAGRIVACIDTVVFGVTRDLAHLLVSFDYGKSWIACQGLDSVCTSVQRYSTYLLTISSTCRIFQSNDGGVHWAVVGRGLYAGNYRYNDISVFDTVMLSRDRSTDQLWRSSDRGNTWERVLSPLYDSFSLSAIFQSSHFLFGSYGSQLLRSSDLGLHWDLCSRDVAPDTALCIAQSNTLIGVVNAEMWSAGKVVVSNDDGQNWTDISANLPQISAAKIHVWEGFVYLINGQQTIWRRSLSTLSNVDENLGSSAQLLCYPNPANDMLRIQLPSTLQSIRNAEVYNSLGLKVKSADFVQESSTSFGLDVNDIPVGVYVLRLAGPYQTIDSRFTIQR